MSTFLIGPHMRLHEWLAHDKGYFSDEGLDYEFVRDGGSKRLSVKSAEDLPPEQIRGAYQTIEEGRSCDISSACHWTVNMAAAAGHGRIWAEAYSVAPAGIYVPAESSIKRPEDLAGIPITVGYQSGSHYATIQALEPFLKPADIKLHFGGMLRQRTELLVENSIPAATLFNAPMYLAEQLGYRKIVDMPLTIAAVVSPDADYDDVKRYYNALRRAQQDIDLRCEKYTHYYEREVSEKIRKLMDTRRYGAGERVVFLPYTQQMFEETQRWIEERGIFEEGLAGRKGYQDSILQPKIPAVG